MKNIKKIRLTAAPSLVIVLSGFIMSMVPYPYDDFPTYIIVAYILSMSLLVACVKFNFESLIFLAVGFVIPSVLMLIFEFFSGGFLQYIVTIILALSYSLPFTILTTIIIIIKKVKPALTTTVLILAVPLLFLVGMLFSWMF